MGRRGVEFGCSGVAVKTVVGNTFVRRLPVSR